MGGREESPRIDVLERSAPRGGQPQAMDRRLFMQFQVLGECHDPQVVVDALQVAGFEAVLYADLSDPHAVGLLTMSEEPVFFVTRLRQWLNEAPLAKLTLRREMSMFGRTYALGHEPHLEDWILRRPRRHALDPAASWAVWYPLRRSGAFETLEKDQQRSILLEHAKIGMAYGRQGLAQDIRLACHGLDAADNEFVIGLLGNRLHPLSHLVQAMRKTRQTSTYIQSMGPFFVGHTLWQSSLAAAGPDVALQVT